MRTFDLVIGEHIANIIATRQEIRVAHLYEGAQILVRTGVGTYIQVLPESAGDINPKGVYDSIQEGLNDLTTLLKENNL